MNFENTQANKINNYFWSQTIHWHLSCLIYISNKQPDSTPYLLKVKQNDENILFIPSIKLNSHFVNADFLYSPSFSLFRNSLINRVNCINHHPSAVQCNYNYCIISPLLECDLPNFSSYKFLRFATFLHSKNWQAFSSNGAEYWTNRPSVLLNTIRKKKVKCRKESCKHTFFRTLSSQLKQNYWEVYNRSWKPAEASPEFINWLLDYTSEQGLLRLGFTYIDSRPIAMHFWIVQDGTASIFKLAQDKEFDHLSPGTVLMAEMIDWVYAHDEIHCIDFLTGSDEYKKLWMDECRPLYGLEIFNMKTFRGRLLWYRHCIIRFLKSIRSRFNRHE